MRRIAKKTIGIVLVLLGFLALVTPATPGSWLIPIGLELLGLRMLLADRLLAWGRAHPGGIRQMLGRRLRGRRHGSPEPSAADCSKPDEQ